jgi:hypothetical protein
MLGRVFFRTLVNTSFFSPNNKQMIAFFVEIKANSSRQGKELFIFLRGGGGGGDARFVG